jgi:hypothetical protein
MEDPKKVSKRHDCCIELEVCRKRSKTEHRKLERQLLMPVDQGVYCWGRRMGGVAASFIAGIGHLPKISCADLRGLFTLRASSLCVAHGFVLMAS